MDGEKVVEATDLMEALACFLASFYIFNISCPKEFEMSAAFFERIFMKSHCVQKPDKVGRKVVSVITVLNSVLKRGKKATKKVGPKKSNRSYLVPFSYGKKSWLLKEQLFLY